MKCERIEFNGFRNMEHTTVDFSDGINVLWGKNAQGKSNILEGIYYFARGRSFRGAKDREMIRFGDSFSRVTAQCRRDGAAHPTELEIILPGDPKEKKKVYRNGAKVSGISELIGGFRAVLFCPAHLSIVDGSPKIRRTFLDIAISQLSKEYMSCLASYNRLLLQRTAALKSAASGESYIPDSLFETYAEQMATYGTKIASYRYDYMSMLSEEMKVLFGSMTNGAETPSLSYTTHAADLAGGKILGCDDEDGEKGEIEASVGAYELGKTVFSPDVLYRRLTENTEKEVRAGATLWGIHKDDIRIKLNSKDAKLYASQGQKRSLALSMKLAEGTLSHRIGGESPVVLLDDVLSELDSDRRAFVLNCFSDRQIIVTSCEPGLFDSVTDEVRLIEVDGGKVTEVVRES